MNEYSGEVSIDLAGQRRALRFTWSAILELRREFGQDFDQQLSDAMLALDLERIAAAVSIGTGCARSDVLQASPAIGPTITAIQEALRLAFHGPTEATARPSAHPIRAAMSRLQAISYRLLFWTRSLPV